MQAVATFRDANIQGTVRFTQSEPYAPVLIDIDIRGLRPHHKHGFHVHEYGDMTDHCTSMCSHFNPYGEVHGGPTSKHRHVGDLGNLQTDRRGHARYQMTDPVIRLHGTKCNIVGRGLIIHADEDDLGLGANEASKKNGNAGDRIACAVIGWAQPMPHCGSKKK